MCTQGDNAPERTNYAPQLRHGPGWACGAHGRCSLQSTSRTTGDAWQNLSARSTDSERMSKSSAYATNPRASNNPVTERGRFLTGRWESPLAIPLAQQTPCDCEDVTDMQNERQEFTRDKITEMRSQGMLGRTPCHMLSDRPTS